MTGNQNKAPAQKPAAKKSKSISASAVLNKTFLYIFLPIILVVTVVAVILIIRGLSQAEEASAPVDSDYVYVLPIPERTLDLTDEPSKDPFTTSVSSVTLDGIMYNPNGTSVAILISANTAYVVGVGGPIGDTGYKVTDITSDTATIEKDGKSETLSLAQNSSDAQIVLN